MSDLDRHGILGTKSYWTLHGLQILCDDVPLAQVALDFQSVVGVSAFRCIVGILAAKPEGIIDGVSAVPLAGQARIS